MCANWPYSTVTDYREFNGQNLKRSLCYIQNWRLNSLISVVEYGLLGHIRPITFLCNEVVVFKHSSDVERSLSDTVVAWDPRPLLLNQRLSLCLKEQSSLYFREGGGGNGPNLGEALIRWQGLSIHLVFGHIGMQCLSPSKVNHLIEDRSLTLGLTAMLCN